MFKAMILIIILSNPQTQMGPLVHQKDFTTLDECTVELEKGKREIAEHIQKQQQKENEYFDYEVQGKCVKVDPSLK